MGRRNLGREELLRLKSKTLDARFKEEIQYGLNCSPFEAEAVVEVVREVYFPFIDEACLQAPPGKITLVAVDADEPAGKPVKDCAKVSVCLTLHRGEVDDEFLLKHGPTQFRRLRIADLCQEALSQGALLTREDLAHRVFFISTRTISRDLAALRDADPDTPIPLRSAVHDIGPLLTHRVRIVQLALEGRTTSEICSIMRHSPGAVSNYLSTFAKCAQLSRKDQPAGQIAFLLKRGKGLVNKYLDLLAACEADKNMSYHLDELLRLGRIEGGKKQGGRRPGHGRQA